jgi:hypothetical protein
MMARDANRPWEFLLGAAKLPIFFFQIGRRSRVPVDLRASRVLPFYNPMALGASFGEIVRGSTAIAPFGEACAASQ